MNRRNFLKLIGVAVVIPMLPVTRIQGTITGRFTSTEPNFQELNKICVYGREFLSWEICGPCKITTCRTRQALKMLRFARMYGAGPKVLQININYAGIENRLGLLRKVQ